MRKLTSNILHVLAMAALALVVSTALAGAGEVTVNNAWMRALPSGLPAGGYFTLHNGGPGVLILTGASSPACGMLMLHKSSSTGGMAHMEDVEKIDVPAGGTVIFAPGGHHLMCMDQTPAVKAGGTIPVTLFFADSTRLTASFAIRSASGK